MFCYAPCSGTFTDLLLSKVSNWSGENNKKTSQCHVIENILFMCSTIMCCNIPNMAALDSSLWRGRKYSHSQKKKNLYLIKSYTKVPFLFNQIKLCWNNMTEFLPHVDANRQCSRYLHREYHFKTRQTNKKKSLLNSFDFLEFAKAAYC